MIIGVSREIKQDEHRVGLVPGGAYGLVKTGHQVLVEQGAGLGSGILDAEYTNAGAQIVVSHAELFAQADMIIKVKEPLAQEYQLLRAGQLLFTFLHLAALPELSQVLLDRRIIAIGPGRRTGARAGPRFPHRPRARGFGDGSGSRRATP